MDYAKRSSDEHKSLFKNFAYTHTQLHVNAKKVFSIYPWFNKCAVMRGFSNKSHKELLWGNVATGPYKKTIQVLQVHISSAH